MAKKNTVMNPIKKARIAAGLTQKKMSELLGIPLVTIECWDRGVRTPPEEAVVLTRFRAWLVE